MKKITTAIIGNVHHKLMAFSLENTANAIPECEDVLVVSDQPVVDYGTHVSITPSFTLSDYNEFCLTALVNHVKTEYVLIVQYDGMAVNKQCWTDEYFNYDYIGAPWPERLSWIQPHERVGNGGFSLRSAKLLTALKNASLVRGQDSRSKVEDAIICQANRALLEQQHGINFAPIDLADRFSHEWCSSAPGQTLGFHGVWNVPLYFDETTTYNYFATLRLTKWYDDQFAAFVANCKKRNYLSVLSLYNLI